MWDQFKLVENPLHLHKTVSIQLNQLLRITLAQGYWWWLVGVKSRSSSAAVMRLYSSSFSYLCFLPVPALADFPEWHSDLSECITHVQQVICLKKWRNQSRPQWVQLLPFRFPLGKKFMKAKGMLFLLKVPGGANLTSPSSPFHWYCKTDTFSWVWFSIFLNT